MQITLIQDAQKGRTQESTNASAKQRAIFNHHGGEAGLRGKGLRLVQVLTTLV